MADLYSICHEAGGMTAFEWNRDPKRVAFILARYKFIAKMLEGKRRVLEVGCADGFGSRVVKQTVGQLVAVDIDRRSVVEAQRHVSNNWPVDFYHHDILAEPMTGFDAAYCLDVFEHIEDEDRLLRHLFLCAPVVIIGTPSLESQAHASELSKAGHVNCKSGPGLRKALEKHWKHVFMFSMNDEVVHTGFQPMAHYLLAVCVNGA